MSVAEELQQNAINNAATQVTMANAYAELVAYLGNQLLNKGDIKLPDWDSKGLESPGTVWTGIIPFFSDAYSDPGAAGAAPDVFGVLNAKYEQADPAVKAAVDSGLAQFSASQCPGYLSVLRSLELLLDESQSTPISEAERAELLSWAESKADADRQAAQQQIMAAGANGFDLPQFSRTAALNRAETAYNDVVATQRSGIVAQTIGYSVQMRQQVMSLKASLTDGMRQSMLSYAGIVLQAKQYALQLSQSYSGVSAEGYRLSMAQYEGWRASAVARLRGHLDASQGEINAYRNWFEAQVTAKKLEYESVSQQTGLRQIPYNSEFQRNLTQRQTEIGAMEHVLGIFGQITSAFASIAQAAESGINAIASANTEA